MEQVKDLTELTLRDLWKGGKSEEEWWGDISERVMKMVKLILESSLDEELLEMLQASRYQRTEVRRGHRNGYYEKTLYTRFGVIKGLRIPRARESYPSRVLPRYQRVGKMKLITWYEICS